MAGCVLCRSSSSTMMRSISWWEMSIVNESSIADPNPSGFTFSRSFGIVRVARCAVRHRVSSVVYFPVGEAREAQLGERKGRGDVFAHAPQPARVIRGRGNRRGHVRHRRAVGPARRGGGAPREVRDRQAGHRDEARHGDGCEAGHGGAREARQRERRPPARLAPLTPRRGHDAGHELRRGGLPQPRRVRGDLLRRRLRDG